VTGDRCEIWAPTQSPGIARQLAAEVTGFDVRDVHVHTTFLGGGFGRRLNQDYVVEAVRIARRVPYPVKVVWSREDDMRNGFYRPMMLHRLRGAVDGRGRPAAWLHRIVGQSVVAHAGPDFLGSRLPAGTPRALRRLARRHAAQMFRKNVITDFTSTEGAHELPYAIRDLRVEYTAVETGVPIGWWRSVGHSHTAFAVECFLDELAGAGGQDPLALRLELLDRSPRLRGVLELAAARAGWGSPASPGRGWGLAVHESFHSYCAQAMEVSVEGGRVRVHRVVAAIDCGRVINPDIVRSQVESAVIFGLSAALFQEITFEHGRVRQGNFDDVPLLRMNECPAIEVHIVASDEPPTGVGEPGVPPVAPALCNAIFAATGRRLRRLPVTVAMAEGG
jgi:isoquinoline 1-oxidoreductase subunit beta